MVKRGRKKNISIHTKSHQNKLNYVPLRTEDEDIILHIPIRKEILQKFQKESSVSVETKYEYQPSVHMPQKQDVSANAASFEWLHQTTSLASNLYKETKPMSKFATYPFTSHQMKKEHGDVASSSLHNNKICSVEHINTVIHDKKSTQFCNRCLWCTCNFKNKPYHLPLQRENHEYVVYGYFCSAECAASYNFYDSVALFGDVWDRYSLLHSLYYKEYKDNKISLAPSRTALSMYGGTMTVDEFRNCSKKGVGYVITFDPVRIHNTHHNVLHVHTASNDNILLKRKTPVQRTNLLSLASSQR